MKKARTEEKVIEQTYYDFYCNSCGELINTSMECDDGSYYIFGETKGDLKLSNESKTFQLQFQTELCPKCYDSLIHEMDTVIKDLLQKYGVTYAMPMPSNDDKKKWAPYDFE